MNLIDKYFREKANKVSFIELKDRVDTYERYGIKEDIPLPIILDDMMDGIKYENFQNEINIKYILEGMLYMIAIDPEFIYINDYKNIIRKLIDEPSKFALSKALENIDINNEAYIIYTRSAFLLDEKNELAANNYARILWNLDVKEDERHVFVEEAVRILERVLRYNDKSALANFELGNIFSATGDFIKADSYYKRALNNSEVEELEQNIRDRIQKIAPDVAVTNSIYFINKMNYNQAINDLMEVRKNSSRYDIPYYIAIAYMNSNNFEMAEQFFEESIDKGADFATLYTDLVYVKYMLKKDSEAIHLANDAIEKYPTEIKLRYNRAIILISLNKFDKANEDLDFILEYQDLSDEMFNQIMKIKESMLNN